jgi:hypothetical protein
LLPFFGILFTKFIPMPLPASLLSATRPDKLSAVRELIDKVRRDAIPYFPSPIDWRDEIFYFLLPDRFSDGQEDLKPLLDRQQIRDLRNTNARPDINWKNWAESGTRWQGGTINGIRSKLNYLKDLGISTIWLGPVFKQRVRLDTFHGYGVRIFWRWIQDLAPGLTSSILSMRRTASN